MEKFCELPFFAWFFFSGWLGSVLFVFYKMFKGKNITSKVFSVAEKQMVEADARELMDNQIRTASFHIVSLRCMLREEFIMLNPLYTKLEYEYVDLLSKAVTDNLMQHFQIDLVRNHITKKSGSELTAYATEKAIGYRAKVRTYLDDYNKAIKKYDFGRFMDNITEDMFIEIYLRAYTSAVRIASGY